MSYVTSLNHRALICKMGWGGRSGNSTACAEPWWELNEQMHLKCLAQGLASSRCATNHSHHWHHHFITLSECFVNHKVMQCHYDPLTCPAPKPIFSATDGTPLDSLNLVPSFDQTGLFLEQSLSLLQGLSSKMSFLPLLGWGQKCLNGALTSCLPQLIHPAQDDFVRLSGHSL